MRENILQLIEAEHPFENAVTDIVEGLKRDFFQLEDGAIAKDEQERAISELETNLRAIKQSREDRLVEIYQMFDEQEIDALLLLSRTSTAAKLRQAMIDTNILKWKWVNAAKDKSEAMSGIIKIAQTKWNDNNVGEHATIAEPLEDLGAPSTPPADNVA